MKHTFALRGTALAFSVLLVCASACEEKAPPPTPTGGGGRLGSVARGVRDTVRSTEGAINDNQQKAVDAANDIQAGNASQAGKAFGLAGVEFTLQPGWTAMGVTGSMRKADLLYKGSAGEVHALFYTFGGSAEANIDRWISEVESSSDPKRSSQEVNGLTVHKVDIRGTYNGMMADNTRTGPQPNTRVIGVVIEGGRGPTTIQIKIVGPEQVVNEAAASFDAMLRELRKS